MISYSTKQNSFPGFNPEITKFLKKLEKNNNKEWFDANRDFYINEIREPIKQFVMEMSHHFYRERMNYLADPKISVFRINRDIRFSKNKDPYKTNLGIFFPYTLTQTVKKKPESIGLYLHYESGSPFIAGGIHMPQPPTLKAIRTRILEDYEIFEKIIKYKNFKKEFPEGLVGEKGTKTPLGFPKNHPANEYLLFKEYTVFSYIEEKDFFSTALPALLVKKGKAMNNFCDFLLNAIE